MTALGVTGGIGMGKSTAGQLLEERGIPVLDTDILARRVVEPGTPGLAAIRQEFGPAVFHPDGTLDRAALGKVVFNDSQSRSKLEQILHPLIARGWRAQLEQWRAEGRTLGAILIPLLFEKGYQEEFSASITVACTSRTQRERLELRGWDTREIEARNRAQLAVEEKMARARFVVWTEGGLVMHARQWDCILGVLRGAGGWHQAG